MKFDNEWVQAKIFITYSLERYIDIGIYNSGWTELYKKTITQ